PDRFANLSPEEAARIKDEERLKKLEQQTADALINILHDAPFTQGPGMASSGHQSRDYTEVLRRFNEEIRLPMVTLSGVAADPQRQPAAVDIAGVLAGAHISDADAELLDDTLFRINEVISTVHMDPPPGDCIVSLLDPIRAP
ncbi:hypothetical protein IWQ56_006686, partial [Coemansia nantahalensis]